MNRRKFLKQFTVAAATSFLSTYSSYGKNKKKPNIIVFLVDDMGFSDPGYMGGDAQTPNLDKLSDEGVTFVNCFNNAKCAPTRAALMTGMSCQRVKAFKSKGNISENNAACMAEILGENGYETIISGKWHIAPDPMKVGFQHRYGVNLAQYYFKPDVDNAKKLQPIHLDEESIDLRSLPEDWFSTTAYTDYAIKSIKEYAIDKGKPFFLYLAVNAPHSPLTAHKKDLEKYKHTFKDGAVIARKKRYERLVKKGIINPKTTKLPPYVIGKEKTELIWDKLSSKEKKLYTRKLQLLAAMVDRIDQEAGKLFKFLKKIKEFDNTIIFFLSDNGGTTEKGQYGGILIDEISEKDIEKIGIKNGIPGGTGGAMSVVQNTPLRGGKTTLWDGGMRTSMIVNWPKYMNKKATDGYVRNPVSIFDIATTCYTAAGIKYPKEIKGRKLQPMDGVNILPLLKGERIPERDINFMYKGDCVIRNEKWKLYGKYNIKKQKMEKWALYDLENDKSEMNDVSKKYPEVYKKLLDKWQEWDKSVGSTKGYIEYFGNKKKSKKK